MTTHQLAATPETVRFGAFDAAFPPVLTIQSGDTVVIETVSGGATEMPESGFAIPPALSAIHAANLPRLGPHIVTGPIAIAGAQPGDMLEVRIDAITPAADWGWCGIFPLLGTLPDEFRARDISYSAPRPGWSGERMTGMLKRKEENEECLALCCEGA